MKCSCINRGVHRVRVDYIYSDRGVNMVTTTVEGNDISRGVQRLSGLRFVEWLL